MKMIENKLYKRLLISAIAIFMFLIIAHTASAEENYVEIGVRDGYGWMSPHYGRLNYSWSECIYRSWEIGTGSVDITAISYSLDFYNSGGTERWFYNQQVYMSHTTDNFYPYPYPIRTTADKTLVYSGDVHWEGIGWQTIELDTPFFYDGTSNLRIMWDNWDGYGHYPYPYWDRDSTSPDTTMIYHYSSEHDPSECMDVYSSYTYRPIIRIHYEPTIPVYFDIKPGSCPNPLNLNSNGVLPVAILGTDEFDVTTIDPGTINISRNDVRGTAYPLSWDYEDVGTPYTGNEVCGCHELEGDGYMDLTLKFDEQELINNVGLKLVGGETIPLVVKGNLKEEYNSKRIVGQDCIWIIISHDVGVTQIISPEEGTAGIFTPEVTVENFGTKKEKNVPVNMIINKNYLYGDLLNEDFSSGVFPPTGWTNTHPIEWGIHYNNYAGGTSPEAWFYYSYATDVFRLYTYPMDTTGLSSVNIEFKHYVYHYDGPYKLHVETSTDGVNWNSVWSIVNPSGNIGPDTVSITTDEGVGSSTFYVSFTFEGFSWNINWWCIDDVSIREVLYNLEYDETLYIDVIKAGEIINVIFPEWTPDDWHVSENVDIDYSISVCTLMEDDEDPWNDCLYKRIRLYYPYLHDVGVVSINSPNNGSYITSPVEVTIENMGQFQEGFNTSVQIKRIGIPDGWTQIKYGGDEEWVIFDYGSYYSPYYEPPGSGDYFLGTWDWPDGAYGSWDVGLFTSAFDLTGLTNVKLIYDRNFQDYATWGHFAVRTYSGGTDISNREEELYFQTIDDPGYGVADVTHIFDPSSYTDPSEVYIEWWYCDDYAPYAWGLGIDNVEIPEIGFFENFEVGEELVYNETVYIDIDSGETIDLTFPNWSTTGGGKYSVIACTQLVGDGNPLNDCMEKEIVLDLPPPTFTIRNIFAKLFDFLLGKIYEWFPFLTQPMP